MSTPQLLAPVVMVDDIFPLPSITTTVLITIAIYNVVELSIIISQRIRPLNGLYFWSFLSATWGIFFYLLGVILKVYHLSTEGLVYATLLEIGWILMVTGGAVVLYSRLHYLVSNRKLVKIVLFMIIINASLGHLPIVAMVYGVVSSSSAAWTTALLNFEKVQVTMFFLQAIVISGIYVYYSVKRIREEANRMEAFTRRILLGLIIFNCIYVCLETSILILEWSLPIKLSGVYKATTYSVKLKLEYKILNRLSELPPAASISIADDVEMNVGEPERQIADKQRVEQTVVVETFNGKMHIMDASTSEAALPKVYSNFPPGEAVRSRSNNDTAVLPGRQRRSAIQHWADEIISVDDDIESYYERSQATESVAGAGLSPSPGNRRFYNAST